MSNWELLVRVLWKILPVLAIVAIPSVIFFMLEYYKQEGDDQ